MLSSIRRLTSRARHARIVSLGTIQTAAGPLRARLNVENATHLKASGFAAGTRFRVRYTPGQVELIRDDQQGTHVIAPKRFPRRDGSVTPGERLDLRSVQLGEQFHGAERVLMLYLHDRLLVLHVPTTSRAQARLAQLVAALDRRTLRVASFYSGIGTLEVGLSEGLHSVGLETESVFANDNWDAAIDGYLADNPEARRARPVTFTGGIEEFIASGQRVQADLVVMGIPCTGTSMLNVASRDNPESHDEAGHQILNAVMALRQCEFPPVILLENVARWSETVSCRMVRKVLEEQGYTTHLLGDTNAEGRYTGLNSAEYGDIEQRVRMALLAVPRGVAVEGLVIPKTGASARTVADIREDETRLDLSAEYAKGNHLDRACKLAKGWKNRIVENDARVTPSLSAQCWKQRIEDPKFRHPTDAAQWRLPTPEEHARLKGHDESLIASQTCYSHAHEVLGNGTVKGCWRALGAALGARLLALQPTLAALVAAWAAPLQASLATPDALSLFDAA